MSASQQPIDSEFLRQRLKHYARLIRLDRPIGIYLLLWPTLWALWIAADGNPSPWLAFIFVAGVVLMRSAGCAINDFADRDIDPHVERTRDRPIACGAISSREALAVFVGLALLAFALVVQLNWLTIKLSLIAVLLAASYPFMKRFHYLPQVHLGAAFSWGIPMAFSAQTGELPPPMAWLIFLAALIWTTAYDTMYAMADREDDLRIGVKSSAILFGDQDRLIIGVLQVMFFFAMYLVGQQADLGWAYYLSLIVAAFLAVYQQWLIFDRKPNPCFRAFLNNNWLGMAIFAGIVVDYLIR